MGIQSWKRGVHTGNTIRVGGFCAQTQSGLVKRQVHPPSAAVTVPFLEPVEEEQKRVRRRGGRAKKVTREENRHVEVEELEELDDNVFYSLNKKGRWNLPEKIQTEIKFSKCTQQGQSEVRNRRSVAKNETKLDQDLTMVRGHPLKGGANCFEVSSTKLPGDGTVSKTRNYLNVNSVLQKKTKQRLRPNKKRKGATPQAEKAQEQPSTEVEISSPYPRNSYMKYAEKSRNSWSIHKDTKQPSRKNFPSEEICDMPKSNTYCDSKYRCIDAGDWIIDERPGDECRVELATHQPNSKGGKSGVHREKTVAEPDDDSHVWFLEEFVQVPSSEFEDDIADEKEGLQGREREENNDTVLNEVAEDLSTEISNVSEEYDDWEFLEHEAPSEGRDSYEGDCGVLAMLIEDALVRKATRLQIAQIDKGINRRKNKKRK